METPPIIHHAQRLPVTSIGHRVNSFFFCANASRIFNSSELASARSEDCGGLLIHSENALSLLGALELDKLSLDVFVASDANYKFLNIVTDGSSVNKLAVRIMTISREN